MNEKTIGSEDGVSLSLETLLGNMEGDTLTMDFEVFLTCISGVILF
jgi:hypothetical protein